MSRNLLLLAVSVALFAPGRGEAQVVEAHPPAPDAPATDLELFALENQIQVMATTTTKFERAVEEFPSIVTVFRRQELDHLGVHTLSELLRYVPGFYEVAGNIDRNFAVRGVHQSTASHFVVLLDGLPTNDMLTYESSPDLYNLDYAARVEIVRGPATSVYGPNALMGVINIITLDGNAESFGENERSVHTQLTAGSNGLVRESTRVHHSFGELGDVILAGSFWRSDGTTWRTSATEDVLVPALGSNITGGIMPGSNLTLPRANAPVRVNAYGPSFNLFAKYRSKNSFTASLNFTRNDYRPQRTYLQSLVDVAREQQPPQYINSRFVLDVQKKIGDALRWGELTFRASLLQFSHDMRSQRISVDFYGPAAMQNNPVISNWSGSEMRVRPTVEYAVQLPNWKFFHDSTIFAGLNAEYSAAYDYGLTRCSPDTMGQFDPSVYTSGPDVGCVRQAMVDEGVQINSDGIVTPTGKKFLGNGDEYRLGGFVQLGTFLPHNIGVVVGGRLDYHPDFGAQFNPRVSLVVPIARGFYAKAQFSQADVYPAFLYRNGNALSDFIGNPGIRPQRVTTYEALVGMSKPFVRVEVNGYVNQVRDFIAYDLTENARTGKYRFSNQGSLDVGGVEATMQLTTWKQRLAVDLNGSFTRALSSSDPQFLVNGDLGGPTKFPEFMAGMTVNLTPLPYLNFNVSGIYTSPISTNIPPEVRFFDIQGTDGMSYTSKPASAYTIQSFTLNANAYVTFAKHWRVTATFENITNARYYRPGSVLVPYLMPGWVISGALSFRY